MVMLLGDVECIDRMYLNVYVSQLQYAAGLVGYVQRQLGLPIASTAPLAKITDRFSREVHRSASAHAIPWVDFVKGQRKDDVMHEHLAGFTAQEGVLFIGPAQEKTPLFRTEKRRNAEGRAYPWIVKSTGVVNQFYFYCVDAEFGPFFIKFCSYFPYKQPRPHPTPGPHPPLSSHRPRATHRDVPDPRPRPAAAHRAGPPH